MGSKVRGNGNDATDTRVADQPEEASRAKRKRILLIDDDDDTLSRMRAFLEHAGYDVEAATNGPAGILMFRHTPPDLVMLDIEMPGMDGLEVFRRLRRDEPGRTRESQIPVVVYTGHASLQYVQEAAEAGVDGYIVKTAGDDDLLERIGRIVRRDAAPDPAAALRENESVETPRPDRYPTIA